jgi:hypothetical protein
MNFGGAPCPKAIQMQKLAADIATKLKSQAGGGWVKMTHSQLSPICPKRRKSRLLMALIKGVNGIGQDSRQ